MKNKVRWTAKESVIHDLQYYFVWCSKFRRPFLVDEVADRLRELFKEKGEELGILIEKIEINPDHVYLLVKASPVFAPHFIVQQLKTFTYRPLMNEFPFLKKKMPCLWTRAYYVENSNWISEKKVNEFIEAQEKK